MQRATVLLPSSKWTVGGDPVDRPAPGGTAVDRQGKGLAENAFLAEEVID